MFVVVASLLAACSSTTSGPGPSAEPGAETASEFAGAAPSGSPGTEASAATNGSRAGSASEAPGRTSTGRSGARGSSAPAPGVLPRGTGTIEIGIHQSENGRAAAQFGANALPPSGRRETEAVIKHINANGGLGGKTIVPVFHTSDPLAGSFDALVEAACRDFTEDHKVFAAMSDALTPSINLAACMAKRKTPLIWTLEFLIDDATAKSLAPYLYQPHTLHWSRLGAYVDNLVSTGFLRKGSRIGLIRYDNGVHKGYAGIFKSRLAKAGLKLTEEAAIGQPRAAANAGAAAAELSSAGLRFRAAQVDRVIFVPSGAVLPYLFMPGAEANGYRPLYGLSSLDPPDFVSQNVPPAQLGGARAVAWLADVDTREPTVRNLPAAQRCEDAVRKGGGPVGGGEFIIAYCEALFLLKDALDRNPVYTMAGLRQGILGLGRSWRSPRTFATRFSSGWHDAVAAVRMMRFDTTRGSFLYDGAPIAVP